MRISTSPLYQLDKLWRAVGPLWASAPEENGNNSRSYLLRLLWGLREYARAVGKRLQIIMTIVSRGRASTPDTIFLLMLGQVRYLRSSPLRGPREARWATRPGRGAGRLGFGPQPHFRAGLGREQGEGQPRPALATV